MIFDFSFLDLLILHSNIFTIYASKYLGMNKRGVKKFRGGWTLDEAIKC